ncbi:hypothetical protein VDS13_12080, partial [Xanthomonas campestris pv. campestris]|nr:hypothetical protein [Xanthomonas campestris pv. campestris]
MTLKNCQNSPCSTNTYWRKAVPLANDPMRFALTALITCLIAGCSLQPPPENVPIAKEQIEMRTVVPLVRSLTLRYPHVLHRKRHLLAHCRRQCAQAP